MKILKMENCRGYRSPILDVMEMTQEKGFCASNASGANEDLNVYSQDWTWEE